MKFDEVDTADDARQAAIDFQHWQSERAMSWEQVAAWQRYFEEMAREFDLEEEFKENGII
jgi:hypothetical protein